MWETFHAKSHNYHFTNLFSNITRLYFTIDCSLRSHRVAGMPPFHCIARRRWDHRIHYRHLWCLCTSSGGLAPLELSEVVAAATQYTIMLTYITCRSHVPPSEQPLAPDEFCCCEVVFCPANGICLRYKVRVHLALGSYQLENFLQKLQELGMLGTFPRELKIL